MKAYHFENDKVAQARSRRNDAVASIMDTFPIVKRKDEEKAPRYQRRGTGHLRRWKALLLLNVVSNSY
jgi:hypothetical protein